MCKKNEQRNLQSHQESMKTYQIGDSDKTCDSYALTKSLHTLTEPYGPPPCYVLGYSIFFSYISLVTKTIII